MRAWLSRMFEWIIGRPRRQRAPAPSRFGPEADRFLVDGEKDKEMELEIEKGKNRKSAF